MWLVALDSTETEHLHHSRKFYVMSLMLYNKPHSFEEMKKTRPKTLQRDAFEIVDVWVGDKWM